MTTKQMRHGPLTLSILLSLLICFLMKRRNQWTFSREQATCTFCFSSLHHAISFSSHVSTICQNCQNASSYIPAHLYGSLLPLQPCNTRTRQLSMHQLLQVLLPQTRMLSCQAAKSLHPALHLATSNLILHLQATHSHASLGL